MKLSADCKHQQETCQACLRGYVQIAIDSGISSRIECTSGLLVLQPEDLYAVLQPGTETYNK